MKAALHTAGLHGAGLHGAGLDGAGSAADDRTPRQRRHDALAAIADGYRQAAGTPPASGAPRSVIVTMTLETLEGRLAEQASGLLADGVAIPPETARRLACDAALIPVVLGRRGEVLDIGQADHEFTQAMHRAAWVRDQGRCAFPRCRNRPGELHHIHFRRDHGPTSLDNAAWLCNFHHWLAHEGGWCLARDTSGNYEWTNSWGFSVVRRLDE